MAEDKRERLEHIAQQYHTNDAVPDKHIEDLCQEYCSRWLIESLGNASSVLELGFGEGIVTRHIIESGRHLTVIEGAASLATKLRESWGNRLRVVHGLFEEFDPGPERYDAVIASHVLEHVEDPVGLLRQMHNWLSPGGQLLVVVPNSESLHRRLAVLMGLQPALDTLSARDRLVGHQRVYSLEGLRSDLQAAGYTEQSMRGFFLKPLANGMMLDYSPALLAAMNEISDTLPARLLANLGVIATPVVQPA